MNTLPLPTRPLSLLLLAACSALCVSCATPPRCDLSSLELPDGVTLDELEAAGRYALELVNADRAHVVDESRSAAPLAWDDALFLSAICHARDMCERQYFAHDTPEGWGPTERIERAADKRLGEELWRTAENIAFRGGFPSPPDAASHQSIERDVHLAYMNECQCHDGCGQSLDAGHRRNILDPRLTHAAIGVWYCPADARVYQVENMWRDVVPGDDDDAYCPAGTTALPPDPVSLVASTTDG